eukprot:5292697-Amphidinium_carterae.1
MVLECCLLLGVDFDGTRVLFASCADDVYVPCTSRTDLNHSKTQWRSTQPADDDETLLIDGFTLHPNPKRTGLPVLGSIVSFTGEEVSRDRSRPLLPTSLV